MNDFELTVPDLYLKCGVNQHRHMSRNTQYEDVNIIQVESEKKHLCSWCLLLLKGAELYT